MRQTKQKHQHETNKDIEMLSCTDTILETAMDMETDFGASMYSHKQV